MKTIYLGIINKEEIFLEKHNWACGWYWSFGYIGNEGYRFHIKDLLTDETDVNKIFDNTNLTQENWWIIRDLFIQAYALKDCAQAYAYGGNQTKKAKEYRVKADKELINRINKDLETVLDNIWAYIDEATYEYNKLREDILMTISSAKF